jgi:hypothetical protein
VFIRGANANHVVLLIDGVRINSATAGTNAFENIPLNQIERIEILVPLKLPVDAQTFTHPFARDEAVKVATLQRLVGELRERVTPSCAAINSDHFSYRDPEYVRVTE